MSDFTYTSVSDFPRNYTFVHVHSYALDIPSARSHCGLLFPLTVERCKILIRKLDARGRNVLLKVFHLRRTRNWQHHGAALENPCKRDLTRRGAVALRDLFQQRSGFG